jgi:acetyl-CoA C-acetyltransferase
MPACHQTTIDLMELAMREAVIVAAARSPIGRAGKGSLTSIRADDLAAQIIGTALAQVPALGPEGIDDLFLGCGLPGGEQGYNMARGIAVQLGYDTMPGTTVTRYCASSLQTTRMAFHAIRAGEGDAFVSAGVESTSRFANGTSDGPRGTRNPVFAPARARAAAMAESGSPWRDPREDGELPDVYMAMGETAENLKPWTASPCAHSGSRSRPRTAASGGRTSLRSRCPRARLSAVTTGRAGASPARSWPS